MKTFQDGDPLFGVMMNAIANLWPNGTAVLSGCTPTGSGAARQVTVAAGSVVINGTVRSVSQQTKTLDAATFDRYDLISVNTSGTVVVTKGTEERRVPALPANSVPIAVCLIETGQTTLPADRIYDSRLDALRLSVLNIDADKNWGGRSITNVGNLSAASIQTTTYTLAAGSFAPCCFQDNSVAQETKTASPVPTGRSGTVYVSYNIHGGSGYPATVWLTLNEVEVPGSRHTSESTETFGQIVTVAPGDTIGLRSSGSGGYTPYNTLFEIRAYMFLQCSAQHNW